MWCFRKIKRDTCPREAFRVNSVEFIEDSIKKGFCVVLCTDENKNVAIGKWSKKLRELVLVESLSLISDETVPETRVRVFG